MTDEEAKKRLLAYTAARATGLAVFLLGMSIIFSNIVRPGGWPQLGAIVAIIGVVDWLLLPRLLKRSWDRQDQGGQ